MRETRLRRVVRAAKVRETRRLVGGALLLLAALVVAGCASGGTTNSTTSVLAQLPWCDQPAVSFQDDSKLNRPLLSDWQEVKGQLGFTPYLPETMPKGTCLALAGGSIHDPIFGGRFLITYYVPTTGPISFSEAPKSAAGASHLPDQVQCSQAGVTPTAGGTPSASPAATAAPALTVCLGTISGTNVSIASAQSPTSLQQVFNALKPDVNWVPRQVATPTPSTTATP